MNKTFWCALTTTLLSLVIFFSCDNGELKQEVFKFPMELFLAEVSHISNTRFFIGGKEVFDTTACKLFIRSEWMKMSDGSPRYNYFDKDNFIKDYVPQSITFIAKDTALIDLSYFIVERNNSIFTFNSFDNQSLTNKSNDFRDNLNLKQTACGSYIELEYNMVNFRYCRNEKSAPLWEDNINGTKTFGMAGRIKGEMEYNAIVSTMLATDTFVFQQYKVRYKVLKRN